MAIDQKGFDWYRDRKGYAVLPARASKPPKKVRINHPILGTFETEESLILQDIGTPERIVRAGGELERYRPFAEYENLFSQFLRVRSVTELKDFFSRFGPLTNSGLNPKAGDETLPLLKHAEGMRELVVAHAEKRLPALIGTEAIRLPETQVALVLDPATKTVKLRYSAVDLLSALWLECGQALASGRATRVCGFCGIPFEVGPGHRRLDAKYCSAEHQELRKRQLRSLVKGH
jgi:hypothetical protein